LRLKWRDRPWCTNETVASYLEKAIDLKIVAADEPNPKLKASLLEIVAAYRKLAHERAARLKLSLPPQSNTP
jgi:hypothetical protein